MSFPTTIYDSVARAKETQVAQGETPLGTRLVVPDGRVFRFAQAGATALHPFKIVKSAALGPWSTMSACGVQDAVRRSTSYTAGATQIHFSYGATGSVNANTFKDGWLLVNSTDTAERQYAKLGSHGALASATALNSLNYVNIPDGLDLELNTETDNIVRLIPHEYKGVIIASETPGGGVVGVPIVSVPISYYFWMQTWGPCPVLQDACGRTDAIANFQGFQAYLATGGTGAIGLPSSGMTGSLDSDSQGNALIGAIGVFMSGGPATRYALINLRLAA